MKPLLYQICRAALVGAVSITSASTCRAQNAVPNVPYAWRNVEINGGGFVSGIEFHPAARDVVYARTDIGGAYRWDSVAQRWIPLTDEFNADEWNWLGIESLALDRNDANRVYLAVGTYTNDWAGNGAILRSNDRGRTWQRALLPFKNGGNEDGRSMGERLAVDPNDGNILFFASRNNGLWKSVDAGASWKQVESFPLKEKTNGIGCAWVVFDAASGQKNRATPTIYAGIGGERVNVGRSIDGGATWAALPGAPVGMFPHHGVLDNRGNLFVSTGDKPGPNGVTRGALWKCDLKSGQWTNISPIKPSADDAFGYAGLTIDAQNPNILLVASMDRWARGDDVWRSTDGGATWKSVKAFSKRDAALAPYLKWGKPEADLGHWIGDVEIDPFNPNRALYVTGATIWGTDDLTKMDANQNTNWTVRAGGIEEVSVSALISPPTGAHLISGMRDIGGFRHDDLTVSPLRGNHDDPRLSRNENLDFAQQKPEMMLRAGDNNAAFSLDGGATWKPFAARPAIDMGGGPVAMSSNGAIWVWSSPNGIAHLSMDGGATWTPCAGLPAKVAVVADRFARQTFYALDAAKKTLLVSTDGARTFAPRGAVLPDGFGRLAVSPQGAGHLWLLGGGGVMRSMDGGATWTKNVAVQSSEALGFGKAAPNQNETALYLSGTANRVRGVFRSDDGGRNWLRINDDRHQYGWIGQAITGDPRVFGRVFFATNGRGIVWGEPAP